MFGVFNGAASLLFSSAAQRNLEVMQITSLPALHSIALGSITIGAFYLNAAYRNDRTVMWWCVFGRLLSIPVFLQHDGPWINVAVFESVCGLSIALSMLFESRTTSEMAKKAV